MLTGNKKIIFAIILIMVSSLISVIPGVQKIARAESPEAFYEMSSIKYADATMNSIQIQEDNPWSQAIDTLKLKSGSKPKEYVYVRQTATKESQDYSKITLTIIVDKNNPAKGSMKRIDEQWGGPGKVDTFDVWGGFTPITINGVPSSSSTSSSGSGSGSGGSSATTAAAKVGPFQTMFGGTCDTYNCWIRKVWNWALVIIIPISIVMLIAAGFIYMYSQGDPTRVALAHKLILGVASGIGLLVLSYFLLNSIIGVNNLGQGNVW